MLATPADLAQYLNRTLDGDGEVSQAQQHILIASALIRRWTRQTITRSTTTANLAGTWRRDLVLPERPVVTVTAVAVAGEPLSAEAWDFNDRTLIRGAPFPTDTAPSVAQGAAAGPAPGHWGGPSTTVTVTYTHGYAVVPDDVMGVCLSVAARSIENPSAVRSEQLGAYSVTYAGPADSLGQLSLSSAEKSILRPYRRSWL